MRSKIKIQRSKIQRNKIRQQRAELLPAYRHLSALKISHYIAKLAWFKQSQHMAFYLAVRGEVDTRPLLWRAWEMGKTCYLPVCHPQDSHPLLFVPYAPGDLLIPNRYGILEPDIRQHPPIEPMSLDVVFTPLVAFDESGNRLGSGKGYYDRTFADVALPQKRHKPLLVGLAYHFQQMMRITPKPWDIPLDEVVVVG